MFDTRSLYTVIVTVIVVWSIFIAKVSPCQTDCSSQAGIPCHVISSTTECGYTDQSSESTQPMTFDVLPIPKYGSDYVDLNVTWIYMDTNGPVSGYAVQYWISDKDDLEMCTLYNFTTSQQPSNVTVFHHGCVTSSNQHLITLSAQPQTSPDTDYAHRITVGFRQDYGVNSALWQPPLLVLHNDSCNSLVEVEVYLAPQRFNFEHYQILLSNIVEKNSTVVDIYPSAGDVKATITYSNVINGSYKIRIFPEPNNNGKCRCTGYDCWSIEGCIGSESHVFLMTADHPKCRQSVATTEINIPPSSTSSPEQPGANIVVIVLVSVILVLGILVITSCVLVIRGFRHHPNSHPNTADKDYPDPYYAIDGIGGYERKQPNNITNNNSRSEIPSGSIVSPFPSNIYEEKNPSVIIKKYNNEASQACSSSYCTTDIKSLPTIDKFEPIDGYSDCLQRLNDDASCNGVLSYHKTEAEIHYEQSDFHGKPQQQLNSETDGYV